MNQETLTLLNGINQAIIKFRGIYSLWSKQHHIPYHEMLVLYTVREHGYCSQKQLCDNYLLPKQTIHNVISSMKKDGILKLDETHCKGREKTFVLSDKGKDYAAPFLQSLDSVENYALEQLGTAKLQTLTDLLLEYTLALNTALEKSEKSPETKE
ncbi:MAG: MarR family winged helix-turn-helix transcriptional regulator [bacterium]|nr:MarR family winged helix-turn-helix transcriptional regulator [bacterium]